MTRLILLLLLFLAGCGQAQVPATMMQIPSSQDNYLRIPVKAVLPTATPVPTPTPAGLAVIVTFYTRSAEEGTLRGITRSGQMVRPGIVSVAVDSENRPVIALGKRVIITGLGEAVVADTGGGLCKQCVDWYIEGTREEAFQLGIKQTTMVILED